MIITVFNLKIELISTSQGFWVKTSINNVKIVAFYCVPKLISVIKRSCKHLKSRSSKHFIKVDTGKIGLERRHTPSSVR